MMTSVTVAKAPVEHTLTFTQATRAIDDGTDRAVIVAHRGNGCGGEENSMPAFQQCLGAGVRVMETDVRYTRDSVPILMHDQNLWRTTDCFGAVRELTYTELQECRLADGSQVPRLEEVLRTYAGRLVFDLDMKEARLDPVAEIIERTGTYSSTYLHVFGPEHFVQAKTVQERYPRLRLMPSIRDEKELEMARVNGFRYRVAEVPQGTDPALIKMLIGAGVTVQSRIRNPFYQCASYARMRHSGIGIIQTDAPLVLLDTCVDPTAHARFK